MTTPVTSVVIGEGGSGGALALASPRDTWCTPDSYLIIAPEAAAAILKRPPKDVGTIADQLVLAPGDLVRAGRIRGIVDNSAPQAAQATAHAQDDPSAKKQTTIKDQRPSGPWPKARAAPLPGAPPLPDALVR